MRFVAGQHGRDGIVNLSAANFVQFVARKSKSQQGVYFDKIDSGFNAF